MESVDPLELVSPETPFKAVADRRPRMSEPLPVKLVTVADAVLPARAGVERELDAFYVGMLAFERAADLHEIRYHAENFDLRFEVVEPPVEHESLRALGIEVRSLAAAEQGLVDREIEYVKQKTLVLGQVSLLLRDPAGNWVELVEVRAI